MFLWAVSTIYNSVVYFWVITVGRGWEKWNKTEELTHISESLSHILITFLIFFLSCSSVSSTLHAFQCTHHQEQKNDLELRVQEYLKSPLSMNMKFMLGVTWNRNLFRSNFEKKIPHNHLWAAAEGSRQRRAWVHTTCCRVGTHRVGSLGPFLSLFWFSLSVVWFFLVPWGWRSFVFSLSE